MKGKHVLITGANSGIGLATAYLLAQKGAKISVLVRNVEKGEKTIAEIHKKAPKAEVDYFTADLSSQAEIRQAATDFKNKYNKLDVLINNAGAFYSELKYSEDDIEMQWAINHVAPFLLTHLLLDVIKSAPQGRIINVSSNAHRRGEIHFDDLFLEKDYSGWKAYCQNKLANVLFTKALARRLEDTNVTVNALHPGFIRTDIGMKHDSGLAHWGWKLMKPFMSSLEDGAATSVYLASSEEGGEKSGKFFAKSKEVKPGRKTHSKEDQEKLYEISREQAQLTEVEQLSAY